MTAKYNIGELNPDSNIVDANVNSIIYPRMIIGMDMIPEYTAVFPTSSPREIFLRVQYPIGNIGITANPIVFPKTCQSPNSSTDKFRVIIMTKARPVNSVAN